jgi:uncharacterized protein (DUF2062 family)
MGIIPVWGLQLLIAIAVAIYLKLNKGLVILTANISLPPLFPFILFLSHYVGGFWLGENAISISFESEISMDFFSNSILQYLLGAITLAFVAGFSCGLISYLVLKLVKKLTR